jgi:integrase
MGMAKRAANGRSTIYQGSDGRWHGRVSMGAGPDGREDRRHVTARTQSGVAVKVKQLENARDSGTVTVTGRTTVAEYLGEWIDRKERLRAVRALTLAGYRTDQRHIASAIGRVRLDRLGPANIEHLWAYLMDRGLRTGHCRRTLNAALNDAVRRGLIGRNPVKAADTPREERREIEPYTIEEMAALLDAARGRRNAARWSVGLALGLRQGEVLGLTWDDLRLDGQSPTMTVRRQLQRVAWQHGCDHPADCVNRAGLPTKRGADCPQRWGGGLHVSEPKSDAGRRTLTLPETLALELRVHQVAQKAERLASEIWQSGPSGGWVFAGPAGGPTDPRADAAAFKDLCVAAGVPTKRLHDLRHSAATMMLASDLDLRTAGQVLGHSQVAQTARYSHILADRRSVAAARIEGTLFRGARRASHGHSG